MSEIPEAKEQALKLFKSLKEQDTAISPNLR
jgi:hypothetical protein